MNNDWYDLAIRDKLVNIVVDHMNNLHASTRTKDETLLYVTRTMREYNEYAKKAWDTSIRHLFPEVSFSEIYDLANGLINYEVLSNER